MVEMKKPLLRNEYERLSKVASFYIQITKIFGWVKQPICVGDVGEFV
jgi:hypothetical protein